MCGIARARAARALSLWSHHGVAAAASTAARASAGTLGAPARRARSSRRLREQSAAPYPSRQIHALPGPQTPLPEHYPPRAATRAVSAAPPVPISRSVRVRGALGVQTHSPCPEQKESASH